MVNYSEILKKSWNNLLANPTLFTPILISLGIFILFAILIAIEAGILFSIGRFSIEDPTLLLDSPVLTVVGAILVLIDFIILLAIGGYIKGMQYGMYKEVVKTNETSTTTMYESGKKYWKKFLEVSIIMILLFAVPALIIVGISFTSPISMIVLIPILIIYALVLAISLVFLSPMIVSEKGTVWGLLKKCLNYAKNNKLHVFLTWIIVAGITLGVSLIFSIFESIPFIGGVFSVLQILASIFVGVWMGLFVFYSYKERR